MLIGQEIKDKINDNDENIPLKIDEFLDQLECWKGAPPMRCFDKRGHRHSDQGM